MHTACTATALLTTSRAPEPKVEMTNGPLGTPSRFICDDPRATSSKIARPPAWKAASLRSYFGRRSRPRAKKLGPIEDEDGVHLLNPAERAALRHLVDCILPAVPIRQFVLSFPFELSLLAATKPEVLRALARIHAEELARHYRSAAKKSGERGPTAPAPARARRSRTRCRAVDDERLDRATKRLSVKP